VTALVDRPELRLFLALGIGLLVGVERERSKGEGPSRGAAGLRTFALLGLVGGGAGLSGQPLLVAVSGLFVATAAVASYMRTRVSDPGLTTEVAMFATFLLGVITATRPQVAVAAGVVMAVLLAARSPLQRLVKEVLSERELRDGLAFAIAALVVLPLLPDRTIDPWGALNPRSLWMLVLLISSLSLVGYVATRLLGADRGIPLTGLTGGLVSSTAVTLAFSRQSREAAFAGAVPSLASGMLLSWAVMFVRVLVEVLVVNRSLLAAVLLPFIAMAAAALAMAWYFHGRARGAPRTEGVPLTNPFSLTAAAKFAAFFAFVLLVVKLVQVYAPESGVYFVAGLAGTTDVDAITLSMAQFAKSGNASLAVRAITIAALTNTAVKTGMVATLGSPALRRSILVAAMVVFAAGAAALFAT